MKIALSEDYSPLLTFQDYSSAPSIDGVFHIPLKKHLALEGSFMEHLRLTDGMVEGLPVAFHLRQISLSHAVPHRINAFHIHPKRQQDELWCVVQGSLKVCLVDLRKESPTCGVRRSYLLSSEAPALLFIPSGVAHGYKAGRQGGLLLYAMNDQFDLNDPNEGRLPWNCFGEEVWMEDRG